MSKFNNKILPISVKVKKKLLSPININNKSVTSTSTKESMKETESKKEQLYTSREKFELDCDNDKKEDEIFLSKLSEREKFFYEIKAKDIYDFLKSLNLIRYIDSFINDGFETKEDLMEIQEDYFEENKNFNKNQQKKILLKAKEYLNEYTQNNIQKSIEINNNINRISDEDPKIMDNIKENERKEDKKKNFTETGVGGRDINEYFNNTNIFNRCWSCFNKLKDNNYIEIKYEGSIVTRVVRFCSEKCKNKFEINIYTTCDNCGMKYDKSKGEFIYKNNHFHSKKCLDEFINKNIDKEKDLEYNTNLNKYTNKLVTDNNIYDPMNDF